MRARTAVALLMAALATLATALAQTDTPPPTSRAAPQGRAKGAGAAAFGVRDRRT